MERLKVDKTLKMYVNGKFIRSESGRVMEVETGKRKEFLTHIPWASRKDLRDAVTAARKAFGKWAGATAYNRGQVLYRLAEMIEDRSDELISVIQKQDNVSVKDAKNEVLASIERCVWYAGWTDKFGALYSSINPVAVPHLNFTSPIPTGVVTAFSPASTSLLGIISTALPALAAGNSMVLFAPKNCGYLACILGEIVHCSDIPAGVLNILTGDHQENLGHAAKHMDINAIVASDELDEASWQEAVLDSAGNLKRMKKYSLKSKKEWLSEKAQSPLFIIDTCEAKTVWHPVGQSIGGSSGY